MSDEGIPMRGEIQESLKSNEDLLTKLVEFYHMYVVHVRDLDVVHRKLCDEISIFDIVSPSDASWATLTFVDNFNGWKDTHEKLEKEEIIAVPSVNDTRWKKCRGRIKFNDRVGPEAREFYRKCEVFFSVVQDERTDRDTELKDMLDSRSREWWKENGAVVRTRKRKAPDQVAGKKGKVQAAVVNNAAMLSFKNLMKRMGKAGSEEVVVSDRSTTSSIGSPSLAGSPMPPIFGTESQIEPV